MENKQELRGLQAILPLTFPSFLGTFHFKEILRNEEEDYDAPHVDVDAVKANLQELKGKASEHFEDFKGKATEQFEESGVDSVQPALVVQGNSFLEVNENGNR